MHTYLRRRLGPARVAQHLLHIRVRSRQLLHDRQQLQILRAGEVQVVSQLCRLLGESSHRPLEQAESGHEYGASVDQLLLQAVCVFLYLLLQQYIIYYICDT